MTMRKNILIQETLRDLQVEIERSLGDEGVKQRQRSVLRGYRVGFWSVAERMSVGAIERTLRQELGLPLVAKRTVPAGTSTEG
jgi:hypothetical protein